MTLVLSEPPLSEPISLTELKAHLRIDHASEDDLLNALIRTAREYLEQRTALALITQSWRLCLDSWPIGDCVILHKTPVQAIDQVEQFDGSGTPVSLNVTEMLLDGKSSPARLYTKNRTAPGQEINGIEISFTAGFGMASDVPDMLKRAILTHAAHMFEFRGVVSANMQPASIPQGYEALIGPWVRRAI